MKSAHKVIQGFKVHSWRRQLPDHRDFRFGAGAPKPVALPTRIDPLMKNKVVIHDQGMTNSCVGHGVTSALEYILGFNKTTPLSRLMVYYHARKYLGEEKVDEGCYIRDAFRGLLAYGVAKESSWKFGETLVTKAPTVTAMKRAEEMKAVIEQAGIVYESLRTLSEIKAAIALGQPVVFGFTVYDSIFNLDDKQDILPMPAPNQVPLGGHCVVADGYDDETGLVDIQNSWGRDWGNDGYFRMPYEWFTSPNYLTGDFWTLRKTS